jgi:hypothetical protein
MRPIEELNDVHVKLLTVVAMGLGPLSALTPIFLFLCQSLIKTGRGPFIYYIKIKLIQAVTCTRKPKLLRCLDHSLFVSPPKYFLRLNVSYPHFF